MRRKKLIVLLLFLVTVLSINVNAKEEYNKSILSFESKTEEIESGKDIHYLINFKVSGNKETYQNYRLNILLPKKEYINFNQNINELMIDNQKPVYDVKNNMLKWNFKTLKSGNSYKLVLKVNTKNSIIPDGSELVSKATLLNTNKIEKEESAKTKLKSTGKLAVSNKFSEVLDSDFIVPAQGKQGIWDFSVSVPKSEFGDKSIKENSQITVSYLLQEGVEYKNVVSGSDMPTEVTKNPDGTTIIEWKYTADSFKNQNANKNDFFSKKYQIITHFKQEIPQFTNVNTVGKIETTFFDMNSTSTKEENATVFVLSSEPRPIDTDGNVWVSSGYGPKDGKGDVTYEILDPVVYDGDLLGYGIGIAPGFATHPSKGFSDYETYYSVDDHLYLAHWYTGSFSYCPDVTYECIPPKNKIKYDVYVKYGFKDNMDENYSLFLKDVEPEEIYYGVNPENKHISEIKVVMQKTAEGNTRVPAGLLGGMYFYFTIEQGYVGSVQNEVSDVLVRDGLNKHNVPQNFGGEGYPSLKPVIPFWGPHTAKVVTPPTGVDKIVQSSVSFEDESKKVIQLKDNKVNVSITNNEASITGLNGDFKTYILISQGIEFKDKTNIKKITNNYKGTQRQLFVIEWGKGVLSPDESLNKQFDVYINRETLNNVYMEAYSYLDTQEFVVPKIEGEPLITDSYKVKDTYDFDNNLKDEYVLKTGNKYFLEKQSILESSLKVKKSTDNKYSSNANSSDDTKFDFKIEFSKLTDKKLSNLVLINTLPDQDDISLTNLENKNSEFNMMLEGPIKLPKEWKNKVSVMYSTTQTPKTVGVLDKDTHYPKDATHLKDAKEAKDATWINAKDVSDWSKIRSFKVETIGNVDWIDGSTKEINYQLHLPKNYKIGKKEVKSYNSFSVATNNLQPTETKDVVVSLQKKKIPKTGSSNTFISINLILVSALAFVMLKRIEEI